jgi:hypothetical protein
MGFSDSQVSPIVAHKHTNNAGDGGSLNDTTLLMGDQLAAYIMLTAKDSSGA